MVGLLGLINRQVLFLFAILSGAPDTQGLRFLQRLFLLEHTVFPPIQTFLDFVDELTTFGFLGALLLAIQLGIESLAGELLNHLNCLELVLMFAREKKLQVLVVSRANRADTAAIRVLFLVVFTDDVTVLDQRVNLIVKQVGDDLVLLFDVCLDVKVAKLVLHHVGNY